MTADITSSETNNVSPAESVTNGHACCEQDKHETKKYFQPRRVYIHRNSFLTDLMEVSHLRTVYNISVALCILLLINAVLYYLADPHMFWKDTTLISWAVSKKMEFVKLWLGFHVYAYLVYRSFGLWVRARSLLNAKLVDVLSLIIYSSSLLLFYVLTTYETLKRQIPPITAFAISTEQVRISMKIYSFVRENAPRAMQYKPDKDGDQQHVIIPPLKKYVYFLFVPTFIYRDHYPQTKEICWRFVVVNFMKFLSCIFISYCLFMRFNGDIFKRTGLQVFTLPEAALTMAGATVVGSIMMFLMFYGILHCWLNVFAELLRFGDREFYQDWWNSTSFSQYYKRWNLVVYDWLYSYIYVDLHKLGCSRSFSMVLVFLVSALVHEYTISLALGYFYPVLMVIYSTIGVFVVFLTKKRTTQFWNTFMWSMLFSGWGMIISLYTTEWYARVNCPKDTETFLDFFKPRSWSAHCNILKYS